MLVLVTNTSKHHIAILHHICNPSSLRLDVLWLGLELGLLTQIVNGPKSSCARNPSGNGRAAVKVLPLAAGFVHPERWAASVSTEAVSVRGRASGVGAPELPVSKPGGLEPERRATLPEDEPIT
jgi:hypothetical protein